MKSIELRSSIEINAGIEKVWDIFSDTSKYLEWNPFIKTAWGRIGLNEYILEVTYMANFIYLPVLMKIIEFDLGKRIVWKANLPGFSDYHEYKFEKIENGRTLFSHEARFGGFFALYLKNHIEGDVRRVHEEMNLALKNRAEAS